MLQWIGNGRDQQVLYNDYRDGQYVTVIRDLNGGEKQVLSRPTYAISHDNKTVLSLDFSRLHYCSPGYGYDAAKARPSFDPAREGIWAIDVASGKERLILSIAQLKELSPKPEFSRCEHYVNHMEFCPDDSRFVFYHRWCSPPNYTTHTRAYTCRPDGTGLYCLNDHDMFSHYCWMTPRKLLGYSRHPSAGNGYYIYDDQTGNVAPLGQSVLTEDGHPSVSPLGTFLVTDTYMDARRLRTLLLYNPVTGCRRDIGKFFVPWRYEGPLRCDLHPRWSRDGRAICVDSAHEGYRGVYLIDVSSQVDAVEASNRPAGVVPSL